MFYKRCEQKSRDLENSLLDFDQYIQTELTNHTKIKPFYATGLFPYPVNTETEGFLMFLEGMERNQCEEMGSVSKAAIGGDLSNMCSYKYRKTHRRASVLEPIF